MMEINKKYLNVFYIFIFLAYLLTQFPFLKADSDLAIASGSRGAWTDEGLYTAPIRNIINQGYNNFTKEHSILKTPYAIVTPLYSIFLYPFFKLFGISLEMGRLITVLFCTVFIFIIFHKKDAKLIGIAFVLSTMMLNPIHQYTHLCLAEMYSTLLIIAAIVIGVYKVNLGSNKGLFLMYTFLICAVLFKIQFIYILPLPLFFYAWQLLLKEKSFSRKQFLNAVAVISIILLSMFLLWYLPFKEAWKYTGSSSSGSISLKTISIDIVLNNLNVFFFSKRYFLFTFLFLISFSAFLYHYSKKKLPITYLRLTELILIWILLESHKITLTYLPVRYLISFYAAMGLFISVMFAFYFNQNKFLYKIIAFVFLISCFAYNNYFFKQAFESRAYKVHEMNVFFKSIAKKSDIVIGPWAPAFTWETKCTTFPIWTVYTENKNILEEYRPSFIVSEHDQNDSGEAFKNDNLNLNTIGDSLIQTQIGQWKINIYAVKNKK